MEARGRVYLLSTVVVGLGVVLVGVLLVLWLMPFSSLELSAARSRWASRPFSRYRLDLEYGRQQADSKPRPGSREDCAL